MESDGRALYIISVAAELAGVHPQTLRIYERKGLIEPQRTQGRSRRYSERDIALLQHIQELTQAGVGLSGVERILELEAQLDAARRRIAELEAQVAAGIAAMRDAVEETHRSYRRELVPVPPRTVVRLRSSGRGVSDREQS
jgi:MerR family transcriptional regulator/heat shock protein HspR